MKICAVICEYNPFHSGHLYQLTKVPAKFDKIACIMSGNFVQRAEPAIADKKIRARAALAAGADIVIENPVIRGGKRRKIRVGRNKNARASSGRQRAYNGL